MAADTGGAHRGVRRRLAALALAAALLAGLLPRADRATDASWTDRALVMAPVTTSAADCTTAGLFTAAASGAVVAGTVAGAALGPAFGPATAGPTTAAGADGRTVTTATSGWPLLPTGGGSWSATASTSGTGASAAAVSGSAALGTLDVTALAARSPAVALPLTGVALDVGTVTATARLDGCAAAWGASGTLSRSATVGALGLRFGDAAIGRALTALTADGTDAAGRLAALVPAAQTGTASAVSGALLGAVQDALPSLAGGVVGTLGATARTPTASLAPAPPGAAPATQRSDPVVLDTAAGRVNADLTPAAADLAGSGTGLVTAASAGRIATATTTALQQHATALDAARAAATAAAATTATASVDVTLTAPATVLAPNPAPAVVATVTTVLAGTAGDWAAGRIAVPAVVVTTAAVPGLGAAVDGRLSTRLAAALPGAVQSGWSTPAAAALATAAAADTAAVATAGTGTAADLAALPAALGVTAGLRPGADADAWSGALGGGAAITALRVRIPAATGSRADLFLGDAAVGPDRAASR